MLRPLQDIRDFDKTKDTGLPEQRGVNVEVPLAPRNTPSEAGSRDGRGLSMQNPLWWQAPCVTRLSHPHSPPGHSGSPAGPQVRRALHVGEKELKALMGLAPRDLLAGYSGVRGW